MYQISLNYSLTTNVRKRARVLLSARVRTEGSAPLLFLRPQAEPQLEAFQKRTTLKIYFFPFFLPFALALALFFTFLPETLPAAPSPTNAAFTQTTGGKPS